ncbi:EAL domain-containing protein [Dehalobacter sp. DCM]|uniref:EAL domain-containing protein n=1 Tax=Dehalobacter sp. DCM TaxID=2907827 RepID=UPI0030815647|nr:EAL domain-containing protein [Dehalobacter sp. DCM]
MNEMQHYGQTYCDNTISNSNQTHILQLLQDESIGDSFMQVLEKKEISTLFQPIVSLKDGHILGFEALSRGPKNSMLESPAVLFDVARLYGKLWELEFLCRIKALENAANINQEYLIFINVDPNIINDENFTRGFTKEFLKGFNIDPENVVFELTEKNTVPDIHGFKKLIDNYKDQGYKIAIDDTGAGYSGLKLITDINPNYIKLDMALIRDLDKDGVKYALIKTLYEFCQVTNIKVIAEGIETENELNALIDIGVDYGQGYFIQKPINALADIRPDVVKSITVRNKKKSALYNAKPTTVFVGDVCRSNLCLEPYNICEKALQVFNENKALMGIPVVENGVLCGLLMRDKFFAELGTKYGYALYVNRPVSMVMDNRPLCVEYSTTIDVASKLAMNRSSNNLYDYIIVTNNNRYFGIVTVKDLLDKTIELEVNYAKHLNPLSGLPGNVLIEQKLTEVINHDLEFTVLYIDIDNFKVYNDIYGFEKGDRMLQFLARTISETAAGLNGADQFVGHIGGDDFIVILDSYDVEALCSLLVRKFTDGIKEFYSRQHIDNQCIIAKNRHGQEEQYPLVTLSIAGIHNRGKTFADIYDLTEQAGRIKKKCKEIWDSCYIIQ